MVPVDSRVLAAPAVLRRARKLSDPLDPLVCQPGGSPLASASRAQLQHLVDTTLAVSALEIFADRQPVDFGRTEVIELVPGSNKLALQANTSNR